MRRVFDKQTTLLKRDVWKSRTRVNGEEVQVLNIRLKSSKTSRAGNRGEIVQVYETGGKYCPVAAANKYIELNKKGKRDLPFFREESGKGMSLRRFNDYLRMTLEEKIPYGIVTAHSFRQGLVTWMAERGATTEEIMAAGRWNSSAWETYVRRPKLTRVRLARTLTEGV